MTKKDFILNDTVMLVFHRLSIVDRSNNGMQPFYIVYTSIYYIIVIYFVSINKIQVFNWK